MSEKKRKKLLPVEKDSTGSDSDDKKSQNSDHIVLKSERFYLKLTESTEDSYPEFNIANLIRDRLKKRSGISAFSDDEDSDVKKLAKEFERKYGPNSSNFYYGNRSNWKNDDYADIGAGYDETDSFIDNSEAYDEIVPENVTTFYGGFYVNYGPLEFKQVNYKSKSSRKILMSDSDSSDGEATKKQKKKAVKNKNQSKKDEKKSVKKKTESKKVKNVKNTNNAKRTKPEKVKDIEIILSDESSMESNSESSEENRFSTTTIDSDYSQETDWNDEINSLNLSKELKKTILELFSHRKEINKPSENKKKHQILDKYLTLIFEQSRSLTIDNRSKLYDKISNWFKIPKSDMIKNLKKSTISSESEKLIQIISKLQQNINEIMPKCQLQFNTEFNRNLNMNDSIEKNSKQPKRKFSWSVQTTKLLNEIVEMKRKEYNSSGTHKETFYSYVISFFKTEIINLWPKGWMGINVIIKHCKNLSDNSIKQNCSSSSTISSSVVNKSQNNTSSIVNNIKIEINENSSTKPQQLSTIAVPITTDTTNICTSQKHKSVIVSSATVTKTKPPVSSICSGTNTISVYSTPSSVVSYTKPATNTSFVKLKPCSTITRTVALTTMTTATSTVTAVSKKPVEIFPITSTPISKQPKSFLPRISIEIQPSIVNNTTTSTSVAKLIDTSSTSMCSASSSLQITSSNLPQTSPLDCRLKREASTLDLQSINRDVTNVVLQSFNNKKLKVVNKAAINNNSKYGTDVSYIPSTCQQNWISHSSQHNYQMKSQAISTNINNVIIRNETSKNLNDDFQLLMNNLKELEQMQMSNSTPSVTATATSSRLHKPVSTVTTTTTIPSNKHPLLNEQLHQHSNQYSVINVNHNSSFPDLFLQQNTSQQSTNSRSSNQKVICSTSNYMVNHCDSSSINNQIIYPTAFLTQKNPNKNSSSFIISNLLSTTQSKLLE